LLALVQRIYLFAMRWILIFTVLFTAQVHAQTTVTMVPPNARISMEPPAREFRAAWIATIANIDWPSSSKLTVEEQKREIIYYFDVLKQNNFNAVIVQIRPAADAFYSSPYEPWSRWLTGKQGLAPMPYYDPLKFMIDEAHKRCIEFHAWFNPYRALTQKSKNPNPTDHITRRHPEWFVNYGKSKYFDPGLPQVRSYASKIIMDVVKRYDIDAVHMDDYFYPYRIGKYQFPDYKSYSRYGTSYASRDDWRRSNVNTFVQDLSKEIKKAKPYVKFGISPFGVWRNIAKDSVRGSYTNAGQTNYDDLFADVLLWQENGWIDYLMPQIYWETGHKSADYYTLVRWWDKYSYKRHVYVGHGAYRLGKTKKPAWQNLDELIYQIDQTRRLTNIKGSCFYSAKTFRDNTMGINQRLQERTYRRPALLPPMPWIDASPPKKPSAQMRYGGQGVKLISWQSADQYKEDLQYAVYKMVPYNGSYRKELMAVTRENKFAITKEEPRVQYAVSALDRMHNESALSNRVY